MVHLSKLIATALAIATAVISVSGCYYTHLAAGQVRMLARRQPVAELLADPATPDSLRVKLVLVEEARDYARSIGLDVGGQYTSYVAWPGDRIVSIVVATQPGEVEAEGFRFPFIGRLPYKGFFDEERAERLAASLREEGLDTCIAAVPAFSTLGWIDDPLTQPLLAASPPHLVETIIHELVHATVYIGGDADFSEGVANFIGQEGAVRFFEARSDAEGTRVRGIISDDRMLADAMLAARDEVSALYAEETAADELAARRGALTESARARLAALPLARRDAAAVAARARLGDACLSLTGTYSGERGLHETVMREEDGDLSRFVARLREAGGDGGVREAFFVEGGGE